MPPLVQNYILTTIHYIDLVKNDVIKMWWQFCN